MMRYTYLARQSRHRLMSVRKLFRFHFFRTCGGGMEGEQQRTMLERTRHSDFCVILADMTDIIILASQNLSAANKSTGARGGDSGVLGQKSRLVFAVVDILAELQRQVKKQRAGEDAGKECEAPGCAVVVPVAHCVHTC